MDIDRRSVYIPVPDIQKIYCNVSVLLQLQYTSQYTKGIHSYAEGQKHESYQRT